MQAKFPLLSLEAYKQHTSTIPVVNNQSAVHLKYHVSYSMTPLIVVFYHESALWLCCLLTQTRLNCLYHMPMLDIYWDFFLLHRTSHLTPTVLQDKNYDSLILKRGSWNLEREKQLAQSHAASVWPTEIKLWLVSTPKPACALLYTMLCWVPGWDPLAWTLGLCDTV